jgi:hypothetical protein
MDIKRHYGVYRGVVADNKDPQKQRRVRLNVPQIFPALPGGPIPSTNWAYQLEGASFHHEPPIVGQGVWVMFIGGDPEYPVWWGSNGNVKEKGKFIRIKPLPNSVNISSLTNWIKTTKSPDGTTDILLMDTLVAMATEIADLRADVNSLQSSMSDVQSRLTAHGI